jgi:hypothetical protein
VKDVSAMKWRVVLTSLGPEPEVTKSLLTQHGYGIADAPSDELPARWHLTAAQWETLKSRDEVREAAKFLKQVLSSLRLGGHDTPTIEFRVVQEKSANGSWGSSYAYEGIVISTAIGSAVIGTNVLVTPEERERLRIEEKTKKLAPFFSAALRDPCVLRVLPLLDEEPTPTLLYHIFEIVKDDMKGNLSALASGNEITRFTRSVNHPEVSGKAARHGVPTGEPPPKPMSLAEQTVFIRRLIEDWVAQK